MRLLAISDLHIGHRDNRLALATLQPHLDDWLIVAGDIGETERHLRWTLEYLTARFARVFWVPGNHELWSTAHDTCRLRGEARYQHLVSVCRDLGVLTPEDPYVTWPGQGRLLIVPMFTLYDYTFHPDDVHTSQALAWAMAAGLLCQDEKLLHPDPYPTRSAWCAARCAYTEQRLQDLPPDYETILINHFPLRRDHAVLPRIPRFSIWCGTRRTEAWHTRYRARVVVTGHLHIRATRYLDAVRFEEVSLGYPRHWDQTQSLEHYLREILPA